MNLKEVFELAKNFCEKEAESHAGDWSHHYNEHIREKEKYEKKLQEVVMLEKHIYEN
jgi:hypothetical protein